MPMNESLLNRVLYPKLLRPLPPVGTLFASFFFLTHLFAQEVEIAQVRISEELRDEQSSTIADVIPQGDEGFYVLKVRHPNTPQAIYFLDKFGPEMEQHQSIELPVSYRKNEQKLEELVVFKDELLLFTTKENSKLKRYELHQQLIDPTTLKAGTSEKIVEIPLVLNNSRSDFSFRHSPDSSKLLIYYDLPYKKGEKERFGYLVFDRDSGQIEAREIKLPYSDELFYIDQYQVDNLGNTFVSGKLYHEKLQEKRRGKVNYEYVILSYSVKDQTARLYVVKLEDKFITDLRFQVDDDANLVCSGFYSEKGTKSIIGSYFMRVNGESGKVAHRSWRDFDRDFLKSFMSEKQVKKGKELFRYQLHDLELLDDGRSILLAEQFYVTSQVYASADRFGMPVSKSSYTYHFKDILAVSIDPAGTIEWIAKVPKVQITNDDGGNYSSYASASKDGRLYLLYNDNPKNLLVNGDRVFRFSNEGNSSLVLVEIGEQGDWKKQELLDFKTFGMSVQARFSKRLSLRDFVIFGGRGRRKRYARVELN